MFTGIRKVTLLFTLPMIVALKLFMNMQAPINIDVNVIFALEATMMQYKY